MGVLRRAARGFKRGWMAFWLKIAWLQAVIILVIVYFIPLGLTSLITHLLRRDFLRIRARRAGTYWVERPPTEATLERTQRQF